MMQSIRDDDDGQISSPTTVVQHGFITSGYYKIAAAADTNESNPTVHPCLLVPIYWGYQHHNDSFSSSSFYNNNNTASTTVSHFVDTTGGSTVQNVNVNVNAVSPPNVNVVPIRRHRKTVTFNETVKALPHITRNEFTHEEYYKCWWYYDEEYMFKRHGKNSICGWIPSSDTNNN